MSKTAEIEKPAIQQIISGEDGKPIPLAAITAALAPLYGKDDLNLKDQEWKDFVRAAGLRTFSLDGIYRLDIDSTRDDCIHVCARNTYPSKKEDDALQRIDAFAFGLNYRLYGVNRGHGINAYDCDVAQLDMPALPAQITEYEGAATAIA